MSAYLRLLNNLLHLLFTKIKIYRVNNYLYKRGIFGAP